MTQHFEARGQQDNPPSFVPSGSPRRSASAQRGSEPESFAPAARSRSSAASQSAQPAQPQSASAVPPSFSPASHGAAGFGAAPRSEARSSRSTSSVPSAAPAASPAAPAAPAARGQRMAFQPRSSRRSAGFRPAQTLRAASSPTSHATTRIRRRKPRHIVMIVLLALLLALGLSLLGAWNWVNGQLVKQPMLTSKANTPAQTWLILGSDERDANDGTGITDATAGFRTDTILVLTKPASGNSSLISIPRDSLVKVSGKSMKINAAAQSGGYPALTGAVEDITGMNIDHVAVIHFGGLQKVVDALGGVDLCYDRTVNDEKSGLKWEAGCHTADGSTALAFSRMRYSDPKGDFGRAERQRQVIAAIVKKASSRQTLTNVSSVKSLLSAGLGSIVVDEHASTWSLMQMAFAFKDASGDKGVTGTVYWTNADYRAAGVGSAVLLDDTRNTELFTQLANGSHDPGTVGGM